MAEVLPACYLPSRPNGDCILGPHPTATLTTCLPPLSVHSVQYDDPVLLAADVEKKEDTVRRVCEPILSKKPPPPPKKEEPAPQVCCGRC